MTANVSFMPFLCCHLIISQDLVQLSSQSNDSVQMSRSLLFFQLKVSCILKEIYLLSNSTMNPIQFVSADVHFCSNMERLQCVNSKLSKFHQGPAFQIYCGHCLPQCTRTEYDVTTTSGVISDHDAVVQYLTSQPISNLQEIGRIKVLQSTGFNLYLAQTLIFH